MSITDDIEKVLEMHAKYASRTNLHNFEDDLEPAMTLCDLAPRLAAWAQRVMPLVEAAEKYRAAVAEVNKWFEIAPRAEENEKAFVDRGWAEERLIDAARNLNLEVPR